MVHGLPSIIPPARETAQGLVVRLLDLLQNNPKLNGRRKTLFCTEYPVPPSDRKVRSWKIDEWAYGKPKNPLPTNARGLFTYSFPDGSHHIVIRGYDKFFNIGQTRPTTWEWIEKHSKGPYELTLKENGCIIFISAMPDGGIIVTSKHSIGALDDPKSHSARGLKWLQKHLATVGKTTDDFAKVLRSMNATAVAELCDDEFEEHILEYPPERSGLYLHGINKNVPQFMTYPFKQVCEFAQKWGFRQTTYLEKYDINSLKKTLDDAAKLGGWEGRSTEGFVIRCKARNDSEQDEWYDHFFKFKFDEPYLMYRRWRELTKQIIAGVPINNVHKKETITRSYLKWVRNIIESRPSVRKEYPQNHGIIALREEFLAQYKPKSSSSDASSCKDITLDTPVVLVPIATIGCGKTTIGLALSKLFGWGHVQNDNNTIKKAAQKHFAKLISQELEEKKICIADRNNHLTVLRRDLINDVTHLERKARFIALHWVHDDSVLDTIRKVALERVLARGDNHQSIQASEGAEKVKGIMDKFVYSFEPCNNDESPDDNFDFVINLDPLQSSRQNLQTIVTKLREYVPALVPEIPPPIELDSAIKYAIEEYRPEIRKVIKNSTKKKVTYFAGIIRQDVKEILRSLFETHAEWDREFWDALQKGNGVKTEFHVTLIHKNDKSEKNDIWQHYKQLHSNSEYGTIAEVKVKPKTIVWNGQIMALTVDLVGDDKISCASGYPHITVGMADSTVKPVEALKLLQNMALGEVDGLHSVTISDEILLDADVQGVC